MWRRVPGARSGLKVRRLGVRERGAAVGYLARDPETNLFLLDLARGLGSPPAPGEARPQVLAAWRDGQIRGVLSLYPSLVIDSGADAEALESFLPYLASVKVGLVKGSLDSTAVLWKALGARGRHAVVDRMEWAYALRPARAKLADPPASTRLRPATKRDLDALVVAARESLREESRPDPFPGNPAGFREWVRGRIPRAKVVDSESRVAFVGYADVRLREGWLVQGVYTWPEFRRRGLGAAGVSSLCADAFAAGADHVQLSVVEGNTPGTRLYERLGFHPFARLRTILFA